MVRDSDRPLLQRLGWMGLIWFLSVAALAVFGGIVHLWIGG